MVHFFAGGAVIFGFYLLSAGKAPSIEQVPPTVHIGAGEVAWLQETFARQWQRPATREEMIALLTTHLKEELLSREARALGLERGDTLVRRRLAQKMSFMLEDTFRLTEPTDAELQAYFTEHATQYERGSKVTFGFVYFDPDKRNDAEADARAALEFVNAKHEQPPMQEVGDRLLIESPIVDADRAAIAAQFGDEFAATVLSLPEGSWQGPIRSAYGVHLVYVDKKVGAEAANFEDVRTRVQEDWYQEHQRAEIARYFAELMQKYKVETDADVGGMIGPLDELLPQVVGDADGTR